MYLTLMFVNPEIGTSRTYDLVFHPCPVWMKGDAVIVVPNNENPRYQLGSLKKLIDIEKIEDSKVLSSNVFVSVNYNGIGHDGDLGNLLLDLEKEGWNPIVLNVEEGRMFFHDGRYGLSE